MQKTASQIADEVLDELIKDAAIGEINVGHILQRILGDQRVERQFAERTVRSVLNRFSKLQASNELHLVPQYWHRPIYDNERTLLGHVVGNGTTISSILGIDRKTGRMMVPRLESVEF